MIPHARSWLPDGALLDGALARVVASAATDWTRAWFGRGEAVVAAAQGVVKRHLVSSEMRSWASGGGDVVVVGAAATATSFAEAILGQLDAKKLNSADRALLEALGEKCLLDLLARLSNALGGGAAIGPTTTRLTVDEAVRFSFGGHARDLELLVATPLAARARKALLPQEPKKALSARSAVIDDLDVEVGAIIGEQRLTIGDLHTLDVGDVLVFERGLGDEMEVAINGDMRRGLTWTLQQQDERLQLKVQARSAA